MLTQPCAAPVQQKFLIEPIFNSTSSFFVDMLRCSFPQPYSPISYACKPEIFMKAGNEYQKFKKWDKMLIFAVLLRKRPVEPQVYNGTWAAVRPGVFYCRPLALWRVNRVRVYLLQDEHLATSSVGVFDYFMSSQEHKYRNLKPK